MTRCRETYEPPSTLDATINARAEWTPATVDNGAHALLLTATLRTLEAAALLGAVRLAFGLEPFDSTITHEITTRTHEAA